MLAISYVSAARRANNAATGRNEEIWLVRGRGCLTFALHPPMLMFVSNVMMVNNDITLAAQQTGGSPTFCQLANVRGVNCSSEWPLDGIIIIQKNQATEN